MKPRNNLKTFAAKIFLNIYEFSSIFKDEIEILKTFRKERKVNKEELRRNEGN